MHIDNVHVYDYACIKMKNVHYATFPLVLHATIAKSQIDENIYNVMRQLNESNFVSLFEKMLYVPVNNNDHVGTLPPFYGTS